VIAGQLSGELLSGAMQPLAASTAGVAARRLTVAVRSQPNGVDPWRLALFLQS
jgi:hypothetical protein